MARSASWTWAALAIAAGCGPKPAAEPASSAVDAPASSEQSSTSESGEEPTSAAPAETAPSASEAVKGPEGGLRQQCEKVCREVAAKCSKAVAESCELNCEKYDKTPKACEPYAREALSCAQSAKDLPCANMAPESCAKQYRTVADCQKAPDSFQVAKSAEKKKLPEGWGIYDEGAFSVPMPGGVSKSDNKTETVWTATVGKVRYSVRKLPPPSEKLTPKSQVRLATEWLKPCQLKMKLHGHVEKGDRSSLHYDVGCKDGSEKHGMVHITPSALYIVGYDAPAGEQAELETFVYGFVLK
jgi:hypothetical protein